jgi:exonuclease III
VNCVKKVHFCRTNCRENNYGTRLDYILVSAGDAANVLADCDIHQDIMGSDHCPGKLAGNRQTFTNPKK